MYAHAHKNQAAYVLAQTLNHEVPARTRGDDKLSKETDHSASKRNQPAASGIPDHPVERRPLVASDVALSCRQLPKVICTSKQGQLKAGHGTLLCPRSTH